jgi:hypothetical protein
MLRVSFSISTNKPNYWLRFCEAVSHNDTELEVIFIGICDGYEGMKFPVPTKFVPTPVNPAQCWEAGIRIATGDIICLAADDCIFSPGIVDDAVKALEKTQNRFDMVTGRYLFDGADFLFAMRMLSNSQMPLLPIGGFTFKDSHRRLSGIDKRFRAVAWDTDLYMRFCEAGGKTHLLDSHSCNETGNLSSLFPKNSDLDIPTLKAFWDTNSLQRRHTVVPFDDEGILVTNQYIRL